MKGTNQGGEEFVLCVSIWQQGHFYSSLALEISNHVRGCVCVCICLCVCVCAYVRHI